MGFYQGQVKQSHFVTTVVVSGFTKYQPWHFSSAGATSHNEVVRPMVSKSDSRLSHLASVVKELWPRLYWLTATTLAGLRLYMDESKNKQLIHAAV